MKKKPFLIILQIIVFMTSCNNAAIRFEESDFISSTDSIHITVIPNRDPIEIERYIDSVYYVKLELTDESIIGQIDKLLIFENKIYILDCQTSSIFIFDMAGNYISKICKIGNGPGEYNKLHYFNIDEGKRHIVLTDLRTNWTMRYDLNGTFIYRKKLPINTVEFAPLPNNKNVSFANFRDNARLLETEYNIIYWDSLMQIEKVFFPYYSKNFYNPWVQFAVNQGGAFYSNENELHFTYSIKNEVYSVTTEGLALKYKFNFNDKNFNYDAIHRKNGLFEYLNKGKYWKIIKVCEAGAILAFSFTENTDGKIYKGFYSKHTGNIINSTLFHLNRMSFFNYPVSSHEDWIICEFPVDNLLSWKKFVEVLNDKFEESVTTLERDFFLGHQALIDRKRLADSLIFDDNPVLMFFKLKPF